MQFFLPRGSSFSRCSDPATAGLKGGEENVESGLPFTLPPIQIFVWPQTLMESHRPVKKKPEKRQVIAEESRKNLKFSTCV